jgi:2-keto-4-pentenoate hydratase/2-oxohepta-3-ene-1,7-dioic acid hydratase in catechol pathway
MPQGGSAICRRSLRITAGIHCRGFIYGNSLPDHPTAYPSCRKRCAWAARLRAWANSSPVGLNYNDHAAETGQASPKEPILFTKATSCIGGPNDPITLPRNSVKTDWEVELGVVISDTAHYVTEAEALKYVARYCLINDVSEREYQMERGGTWDKGKG